MKNIRWAVLGLTVCAIGVIEPLDASSLFIIPTFDSSITSDPNAVAIEGAINAAIAGIQAAITSPNNITVNIYFTEMSSGLGESVSSTYTPTYYEYYNAYKAVATQPDQLTALASLGTPPTSNASGNPVNGNTGVTITSAEGRNLGFNTPGDVDPNTDIDDATTGGTFDGEVALNTSITSPGSPGSSDTYGLQAVANHEIDEVLGIGGSGSTLGGSSTTGPVGDLDLYRYSAPGVRSYTNTNSTSPLAYFSIDGGDTVLSYFSQTTGADFGDWLSNPIPNGFGTQVQDAFATPNTDPSLGPNEITAFNVIGYDSLSPEPATLALVGSALLGAGVLRRRKLSKRA